jgi:hypothetical protein
MRLALVPPIALGCVLVAANARAAGVDPVTAEALFLEGRRAADAGNYEIACANFEESERLDPASGTLLNLADCEEKRGQLARAWQHFRQLFDELPPSDVRRNIADGRARSLEGRTPKLVVTLTSAGPASVKRDDTVLGPASLGARQPVDPGHHVIVVASAGRRDERYEVDIGEGEVKELSVTTGDLLPGGASGRALSLASAGSVASPGADPSSQGLPVAHDGRTQRTAAFVLGGLGIASFVTGAAFGVAALSQLSSANADCVGSVCSSQNGINQFHGAQSFALVADVTMGVGIVCIGTAVVLAWTAHRDPRSAAASLPMWLSGRF